MTRNIDEDLQIMTDSKDKIKKVINLIDKLADNGLYTINSKEDLFIKKRWFRDTWFRLISKNPKAMPQTIAERYLEFSNYFKQTETKEIIDVIETVEKIIDKQIADITKLSKNTLEYIDSNDLKPELKRELIIKIMKSIKEKAENIEKSFNELIYCIFCGRDFSDIKPIHLDTLLNIILQDTHRSIEKQKIILIKKISRDMPPLNIDNEKILEVIKGLLNIFIKSMSSREKLIVSLAPTNKCVTLQIASSNTDIKKDFEPFHLKGEKVVFNSLMYSYKRIIEAHRGTIKFESNPGHSIFTIELPIS
jgi:signal transduction histidine kinase